MTAAAMLSREGRRWGVCDNDDGEEEVVEVDDSDETHQICHTLPECSQWDTERLLGATSSSYPPVVAIVR